MLVTVVVMAHSSKSVKIMSCICVLNIGGDGALSHAKTLSVVFVL